MAKYTGTVRHNTLEGGFFELQSDDGTVYRLQGDFTVTEGSRVRVHGTVESGGFGLQMSGPAIAVDSVETI